MFSRYEKRDMTQLCLGLVMPLFIILFPLFKRFILFEISKQECFF